MKILSLESVDSTQKHLKELIRENKAELPCAVVSDMQTEGVGSRGNSWEGIKGNLFLSFALYLDDLPHDLKLESASIYFAYILKETLGEFNSEVWLKWPNDFYLGDLKIGGMITNVIKDTLVCGVGLNMTHAPENFSKLDVNIEKNLLLEQYFKKIEKKISWKQVFSKYELEFYKNKDFFTHDKSVKVSLKGVSLQSDGSIISNGKRIFSLR